MHANLSLYFSVDANLLLCFSVDANLSLYFSADANLPLYFSVDTNLPLYFSVDANLSLYFSVDANLSLYFSVDANLPLYFSVNSYLPLYFSVDTNLPLYFSVDANLYSFVYETIATNASAEVWEEVLQEYKAETLQSKQRYLMKALASSTNMDIIKKILEFTLGKHTCQKLLITVLFTHLPRVTDYCTVYTPAQSY